MKAFVCLMLLLAQPALAERNRESDGSFTGNGADRKGPGYGAAWFLGDRPVRWCGNHPAIAPALAAAAGKWRDYLTEKKIPEALRAPAPFALRFEESACSGADLEVHLSEDPGSSILSSSELKEQNLASGWARGRIWLSAALLTTPGALETQLLHQLGHLLGNDHVGGTIMDEVITSGSEPKVQLRIDGQRELFLCLACPVEWTSSLGRTYSEKGGIAEVRDQIPGMLRFTANLASHLHGGARLFTFVQGNWKGNLGSMSIARLGLLEFGGSARQVLVRRNFDKLLEVHILRNGNPELFLEVNGK